MTPAELRARVEALAGGTAIGRHVYAALQGDLPPLPSALQVRRLDGEALLLQRDWPPGPSERGRAVAEALGGLLEAIVAEASPEPLLVLIDDADLLAGEIGTLAPALDRFVGDNRMLLFSCAGPLQTPALFDRPTDAPAGLIFTARAALKRLAGFSVQAVEPA